MPVLFIVNLSNIFYMFEPTWLHINNNWGCHFMVLSLTPREMGENIFCPRGALLWKVLVGGKAICGEMLLFSLSERIISGLVVLWKCHKLSNAQWHNVVPAFWKLPKGGTEIAQITKKLFQILYAQQFFYHSPLLSIYVITAWMIGTINK